MRKRTRRLLTVVVVLSIITAWDVFVNTLGKPKFGMISYLVLTVAFHTLAFEAVISNSRALLIGVWLFVLSIPVATYIIFDEWFAGPITFGFMTVYTILLLIFLKKEFAVLNNRNDGGRHD